MKLFNRRFVALLVVMFLGGAASSAVIPLFPTYIESELHRPAVFGAHLRFLFFILGGLAAVPAGLLCDHFGRKGTLVLGMTGAISAGALFLTGDPLLLYALCIHAGITVGVQATASQTYMLASVDVRQFGVGSAVYFIAFNLGNAIGSRVSGVLAKAHGYAVMGEVLTVVGVLAWLGAAFALPRLPRPEAQRSWSSLLSLSGYWPLLARREMWWLLGIRFLPTCFWGAVTFTVPLLLSRLSNYDPRVAANYQMVYLIVAMLCQFFIGHVSDRFGKKGPIIVSSVLVALSALLLAFSTQSLAALYVFGVFAAAAAWSLSTTMPRLINEVAGTDEKGRVTSLSLVAWSAAMALGTWGAGWLVDIHPALIFVISAALCAVAVGCGRRLAHFKPQAEGLQFPA